MQLRCCIGAALLDRADSVGVSQPRRVGMLECSTGKLLAMAAFMHHDDQCHDALMQYAVLKEFRYYFRVLFPLLSDAFMIAAQRIYSPGLYS